MSKQVSHKPTNKFLETVASLLGLHAQAGLADVRERIAFLIEAERSFTELQTTVAECVSILDIKGYGTVTQAAKHMPEKILRLRREFKASPLPTAEERPNGLHQKYIVSRVDGSPVDPEAIYFVTRLDPDRENVNEHRIASRFAAMMYAYLVRRNGIGPDGSLELANLADDLIAAADLDLRYFERGVATSILSQLGTDLAYSVTNRDDRKDLMNRANAWNCLLDAIGI